MEVLYKSFRAQECEDRGEEKEVEERGGVDVKQGTEEPWRTLGVKAKESRFSTDGTPGLKWVMKHVLPIS